MNREQKESIRVAILENIEIVKKDVETFKDSSQPVSPDNAIGRITRMEAINSKSISEVSLAKSKQKLKALEKSLAFINDPDFGYCSHCEEPIPYKRLQIMPETPFCVLCAGKMKF